MDGTLGPVSWLIQAALPLVIILLLDTRQSVPYFLVISYSLFENYLLPFLFQWHRRGCVIHFTGNNSCFIRGWIKGGARVLLKLCHFFSIFSIAVLIFEGDRHFWESVKSYSSFPQKHACPHRLRLLQTLSQGSGWRGQRDRGVGSTLWEQRRGREGHRASSWMATCALAWNLGAWFPVLSCPQVHRKKLYSFFINSSI